MDSKQHIDNVLANLRSIFEKTAGRIDALKPKEKIPATKLAEEIGKEIGMTGPQLYPTLKFLFEDYPGVTIKVGAQGGIRKVDVADATPTPAVNTDDSTESKETDNGNKEESNEEVSA